MEKTINKKIILTIIGYILVIFLYIQYYLLTADTFIFIIFTIIVGKDFLIDIINRKYKYKYINLVKLLTGAIFIAVVLVQYYKI